MNPKLQEDCRTLREFYPDPGQRFQVHYTFVHQFLPAYVQQNPYAFFFYLYQQELPGGPMEPNRFIHSRWSVIFEPGAGLTPPLRGDVLETGMVLRRVTDLTMSIQELNGQPSALVQMPPPEQTPGAYFVCVVLLAPASQASSWPRDVQARVFTLEAELSEGRDKGTTGIVCEWTREGNHRNFGFVIPAERDVFLRAVTDLLRAPAAPARASFTPTKDGSPGNITVSVPSEPPRQLPQAAPLPAPAPRKPWWKIW